MRLPSPRFMLFLPRQAGSLAAVFVAGLAAASGLFGLLVGAGDISVPSARAAELQPPPPPAHPRRAPRASKKSAPRASKKSAPRARKKSAPRAGENRAAPASHKPATQAGKDATQQAGKTVDAAAPKTAAQPASKDAVLQPNTTGSGAAGKNAVAAAAAQGNAVKAPETADTGGAKPRTATLAMPPLPTRNPAPKPPTTAEGKFYYAMDALLAPLVRRKVSNNDVEAVTKAIKALKRSNLQTATALQATVADPAARKLIAWYRLRSGFGTPLQYAAFLRENPAWPDRETLIKRAEEQVFVTGGAASRIKRYFATFPPKTGAGYAALASAYLAENDIPQARHHAGKAWRELSLPTTLETGFFQRFGKHLSAADHRWRIDRLLLKDSRWRATRRQRAAKVRRLIPLQPSNLERLKTKARLAVYLRSRHAGKLLAALPKEKTTDWGLEYQRVQLLLRQKKYAVAWEILLTAPDDPGKLVNPDDWWKLRRAGAYRALDLGKIDTAYELVANPGPISINPRKDAAFMAGWIALRLLQDAKAATAHFQVMRKAADGPLSASKAAYWLARAMKTHDPAGTTASLKDAASFIHTFHGQLARQTLDPEATLIDLQTPILPTRKQAGRFVEMDAVKAILIARQAGLPRGITRAFFQHLRLHFTLEADELMLAHLARTNIGALNGDIQMSLRIGKTGVARKQNLFYYAYPVHALPDYNPLRKPPETAFLLAVARQESEFNTKIKSGAGARGILQVMPITARHVCADYKIKCSIPRLTTDETYNTMIASAYIGDRMNDFGGSYVLTLSGYNAGPGRTRQWIRRFGDPRKNAVDTLDWIERIPFAETRKYVMKVLSNVQVYRARLDQPQTALRIRADLNRAKAQGRQQQTAAQKN